MQWRKRAAVSVAALVCCAALALLSIDAESLSSSLSATVFAPSASKAAPQKRPPPLSGAIEEAANDVGQAPPHGQTLGSTEHFTAAPRSPDPDPADGGGGGSGADLSAFCESVMRKFERDHEQLLEKHRSAGPQADEWTGHYAVCGIHQLYNRSGLVLALLPGSDGSSGAGDGVLQVGVISCSPWKGNGGGDGGAECPDVFITARITGPSIVPAEGDGLALVPRAQRRRLGPEFCEWRGVIRAADVGEHQLEVHVTWLDGLGPELPAAARRHPVTLRKAHSKFGRKPHQKYVFNGPCEAQSAVLGSPRKVVVDIAQTAAAAATAAATRAVTPICTSGNVSGRWVRNDNSKPCPEDSPICAGMPALLDDAKPFNRGYIWAPRSCRFRFFAHGSGPASGPCVKRKGALLLMGDSTTREYAQNLRLFDLSRTGLVPQYANWRIEHHWFSRKVAVESLHRLRGELKVANPAALVVNLGPLHLIAGVNESEWRFYVDQWAELADTPIVRGIERKVLLLPSAIHYATSDMTEQRMRRWAAYARERLEGRGFDVLDAHAVTKGRIETSWDGVHHAAERGKAQMKHARPSATSPMLRWNGGASVMLTTILLNMLCPNG